MTDSIIISRNDAQLILRALREAACVREEYQDVKLRSDAIKFIIEALDKSQNVQSGVMNITKRPKPLTYEQIVEIDEQALKDIRTTHPRKGYCELFARGVERAHGIFDQESINLAIVGSRTFNDYELLKQHIDPTNIAAIVSGGARGADTLAERFAEEHQIQMIIFKPDYAKHGRAAPFVRNTAIIEASDSVIAFWDGKSTGTLDSIKKARKLGKPVTVIEYASKQLDF